MDLSVAIEGGPLSCGFSFEVEPLLERYMAFSRRVAALRDADGQPDPRRILIRIKCPRCGAGPTSLTTVGPYRACMLCDARFTNE